MYELAFHLTPDLEAADVATRVGEIQQIVTTNGGTIASAVEPRRIHLSYPIAKKHYGYFTVLNIEISPEAVIQIDTQLKLDKNVLRFMITKRDTEYKELKISSIQKSQKPRVGATHRKPEFVAKKETTVVEQKQMEVDLEKVLEKI